MNQSSNSAIVSDRDELPRSENIEKGRDVWKKDIEFLFSCIALSVGLGNNLGNQVIPSVKNNFQETFGAFRLWHLR